MDNLAKAVLETVVYFDIFDFPLTVLELFKWLKVKNQPKNFEVSELQKVLQQLTAKIETKDGFYFLKGREEIILTRLSRYNISEQKFKRARKYIKLLRFIPFIKGVMICNRLGYNNVHQDSDIDLAVIVKKNRLWLARFLSVGLLNILKVRPKQIKRALAIDLNFFISEEKLNVESLIFDEDFVFPYWLSQFIGVYNQKTFNNFGQENQWLSNYLPNYQLYSLNKRRQVKNNWLVALVRFKLKLFFNWDFWEKWAQKFQQKIMPPELKAMINQDSRVIINKYILKFHQSDNWKKLKVELNKRFASF
ncbi:hypothetical protein KKF32_00720 [Patescibacteria group bacterium]|nr:hypothetical protein [Patescibacteria group bacterium]